MRIRITTSRIAGKDGELVDVWHWQRLDENGVLLDGSGASRNGDPNLKAVRALVKKRFPDDEVEGLGDLA